MPPSFLTFANNAEYHSSYIAAPGSSGRLRRAFPHGHACSHIHPRAHRNATEADFNANRCPNNSSYRDA
ncbi:MAG: hypothetical protein ACETWR_20080 [Anaerolineae bacterium]